MNLPGQRLCDVARERKQEQVHAAPTTANAHMHTTESQARATGIIPKTDWKFVTVPGSRRIRGTMKNTTFDAIQNDGTTMKWWFVVRGEERLLADLDNQWDTITGGSSNLPTLLVNQFQSLNEKKLTIWIVLQQVQYPVKTVEYIALHLLTSWQTLTMDPQCLMSITD